jgi:PHD/YefM family antitoxin component YafN of YafNO toxin-antitoxin module
MEPITLEKFRAKLEDYCRGVDRRGDQCLITEGGVPFAQLISVDHYLELTDQDRTSIQPQRVLKAEVLKDHFEGGLTDFRSGRVEEIFITVDRRWGAVLVPAARYEQLTAVGKEQPGEDESPVPPDLPPHPGEEDGASDDDSETHSNSGLGDDEATGPKPPGDSEGNGSDDHDTVSGSFTASYSISRFAQNSSEIFRVLGQDPERLVVIMLRTHPSLVCMTPEKFESLWLRKPSDEHISKNASDLLVNASRYRRGLEAGEYLEVVLMRSGEVKAVLVAYAYFCEKAGLPDPLTDEGRHTVTSREIAKNAAIYALKLRRGQYSEIFVQRYGNPDEVVMVMISLDRYQKLAIPLPDQSCNMSDLNRWLLLTRRILDEYSEVLLVRVDEPMAVLLSHERYQELFGVDPVSGQGSGGSELRVEKLDKSQDVQPPDFGQYPDLENLFLGFWNNGVPNLSEAIAYIERLKELGCEPVIDYISWGSNRVADPKLMDSLDLADLVRVVSVSALVMAVRIIQAAAEPVSHAEATEVEPLPRVRLQTVQPLVKAQLELAVAAEDYGLTSSLAHFLEVLQDESEDKLAAATLEIRPTLITLCEKALAESEFQILASLAGVLS